MRLLLAVLVVLLVGGFLAFLAANLETTVPVTLAQTRYESVPLWLVVLCALTATLVLIGIFAIAEGAGTRLENRRLRRELHKLETEVNYLRTRSVVEPRPEPDELPRPPEPVDSGEPAGTEAGPASAPVYGNRDDWSSDPDDDAYSGGRAV